MEKKRSHKQNEILTYIKKKKNVIGDLYVTG